MERKYGKVDLTGWNLGIDADAIGELISASVAGVLDEMIAETDVTMPAIFGETDGQSGGEVPDPLTIYVTLPLSPERGDELEPVLATTLGEVLEPDLKACLLRGEYAPGLERIAAALRQLANRIDETVAEGRRRHGSGPE